MLKRAKKRKEPEDYTGFAASSASSSSTAGPSTKRGKKTNGAVASTSNDKGAPSAPPPKSKNTAVYVTGLPSDADAEEIAARFGKFGLIEEDEEGFQKVKLYARDDGTFSGDALVVYFKEDSVTLAVTMLDDAELRVGDPATRMRVQQAQFGHKHEGGGGGGGSGASAGGAAKPRKTMGDKKKATRRIVKMQRCVRARCHWLWGGQSTDMGVLTGSWVNGTTKMGSDPR